MKLLRVSDLDQKEFAAAAEVDMDLQLGRSSNNDVYLVVGGRVAIILDRNTFANPDADLFEQAWFRAGIEMEKRVPLFESWLGKLNDAPSLSVATPPEVWTAITNAFSPVTPVMPLPNTPYRPSWVYGHLPFSTTTGPETVIYRWEAFPTSRRIDPKSDPPTIAADTYAAPASEVPFAPTGFGAVARFALPNLLPACFRWELQPISGTLLECGACVPMYGQSGGGVEVKFTAKTDNRCAVAHPVVLPAL